MIRTSFVPARCFALRQRLTAWLARPLAALLLCAALGPAWAGPVNINAADAATLASELKGVGAVKAQALVDYRQKHGPFRTLDDLALVKGFGHKLIERNRADLRLGGATAVAATAPAGRAGASGQVAATAAKPAAPKPVH
jgi:competence protein ComEA